MGGECRRFKNDIILAPELGEILLRRPRQKQEGIIKIIMHKYEWSVWFWLVVSG
jgi:hypothetical protein